MNKKHGPWVIKESIPKYKNPWMSVREDQVVRPDGKPGIFGVVNIKPGVSVLALDDKSFVYLTKEFHYAIGEDSIETVSGGIDGDETPLQTAKKELLEELGIEAKEWIDLGLVNPFTTIMRSPTRIFLAKKLKFKKAEPEGTEQIQLVKVKFERAVEMVMKSEITHAPSCVLILKAHKYLNK